MNAFDMIETRLEVMLGKLIIKGTSNFVDLIGKISEAFYLLKTFANHYQS